MLETIFVYEVLSNEADFPNYVYIYIYVYIYMYICVFFVGA